MIWRFIYLISDKSVSTSDLARCELVFSVCELVLQPHKKLSSKCIFVTSCINDWRLHGI